MELYNSCTLLYIKGCKRYMSTPMELYLSCTLYHLYIRGTVGGTRGTGTSMRGVGTCIHVLLRGTNTCKGVRVYMYSKGVRVHI